MNTIEFKKQWNPDEFDTLTAFNSEQFKRTPLTKSTTEFLAGGFPYSAAPFLGFGLERYDGALYNIAEYYSETDVVKGAENYWIFGSDSSGNPICMDCSANDKIVLLDHELGFEPIQDINKNVIELALCLLEFKRFVAQIQLEFGQDGFMDSKFTKNHLEELKNKLQSINPNIFIESDFWKSEIENLFSEIE